MNVPIRKGDVLRTGGRLYSVEDLTEHHSGKQRPVFHIALRDIRDNRHISRTLDELQPIDIVRTEYRTLQYLYRRGKQLIFMDVQSFDELELSPGQFNGAESFLKEGQEIRALMADGQIAHLDLPDSVVLHVADTAAPAHAVGGAGSIMKEARLDNGLQIRVPLFIRTGDAIKVSTRSGEYLGKAAGG